MDKFVDKNGKEVLIINDNGVSVTLKDGVYCCACGFTGTKKEVINHSGECTYETSKS